MAYDKIKTEHLLEILKKYSVSEEISPVSEFAIKSFIKWINHVQQNEDKNK
jgi:hypothetical protein